MHGRDGAPSPEHGKRVNDAGATRPAPVRRGNRPSDLRERAREGVHPWYTLKGTFPLRALRTRLGSRHAMTP